MWGIETEAPPPLAQSGSSRKGVHHTRDYEVADCLRRWAIHRQFFQNARTFDARNNVPKIGWVLLARGRDAADFVIVL
jgi:hypothetical protein